MSCPNGKILTILTQGGVALLKEKEEEARRKKGWGSSKRETKKMWLAALHDLTQD